MLPPVSPGHATHLETWVKLLNFSGPVSSSPQVADYGIDCDGEVWEEDTFFPFSFTNRFILWGLASHPARSCFPTFPSRGGQWLVSTNEMRWLSTGVSSFCLPDTGAAPSSFPSFSLLCYLEFIIKGGSPNSHLATSRKSLENWGDLSPTSHVSFLDAHLYGRKTKLCLIEPLFLRTQLFAAKCNSW